MPKIRKIYCCRDCGDKIGIHTALYGEGRCKSCAGRLRLGKNSPNFIEGNWSSVIKHNCVDCGNELSTGVCKRCRRCYHKYIKDNNLLKGKNNGMFGIKGERHPMFGKKRPEFSGKNNPSYIHGLSNRKYPSIFYTLKPKILKRDDYTCQNCKMTNKKHLVFYGRSLEVHHIDYNKQNCNDSNLITLCKSCNIKANHNRDYWFAFYNRIIEFIYFEIC